jgi:hypothetical protein
VTVSALELAALVAVIGVALIAVVHFEKFCLSDLAQTPDSRLAGLTRQGWLVLILFFIPLGGVAYLRFGRLR